MQILQTEVKNKIYLIARLTSSKIFCIVFLSLVLSGFEYRDTEWLIEEYSGEVSLLLKIPSLVFVVKTKNYLLV